MNTVVTIKQKLQKNCPLTMHDFFCLKLSGENIAFSANVNSTHL